MEATKLSVLRSLAERQAKEFVKIGFGVIRQLPADTKLRVTKAKLWPGLENKVFKVALEAEKKYGLPTTESQEYIDGEIRGFLSYRGLLIVPFVTTPAPDLKSDEERTNKLAILAELNVTEFSSQTGTNYRFGVEEIDLIARYLNGCTKAMPAVAKYLLIQLGEFQDLLHEICLVAMEQWLEGKPFSTELMNDLWAKTLHTFGRDYGIRVMEKMGEDRLRREERKRQGLTKKRMPGQEPRRASSSQPASSRDKVPKPQPFCSRATAKESAIRKAELSQLPLSVMRESIGEDLVQGVKQVRARFQAKLRKARLFRLVTGGCSMIDSANHQLITLLEGEILPNLEGRIPSQSKPEPIDKHMAISILRQIAEVAKSPVSPFGSWRSTKSPNRKAQPGGKYDRALISELHQQGMTYAQIAEKVGCKPHNICQIIRDIRKRNRDISPPLRQGGPKRRYDHQLIQQLYYDEERSVTEIAEKLGTRSSAVCAVLERKENAVNYNVGAVVASIRKSPNLFFVVSQHPLVENTGQDVKALRKKLNEQRGASALGGCTILDTKNSQLVEICEWSPAFSSETSPVNKDAAIAVVYELGKNRDGSPKIPFVSFLRNFGQWQRARRKSS